MQNKLSYYNSRIKRLEKQLSERMEEYERAQEQLDYMLNEVYRLRLQRLSKDLDRQIERIQKELAELKCKRLLVWISILTMPMIALFICVYIIFGVTNRRPVPATFPLVLTDTNPNTADLYFTIGDQVETVIRVKLRLAPGYLQKTPDDAFCWPLPEDKAIIVDGPFWQDNLPWWKVLFLSGECKDKQGWVAQYNENGLTMLKLVATRQGGRLLTFRPIRL